MSVKDDLQAFYNTHAEKYSDTRDKHRSDAEIFLHEIKSYGEKTISILEFGCGSGRLLSHLATITWIKIHYVGVDLSKNLLNFAKKQLSKKSQGSNILATFVCDDIVHYLKSLKQESFDFVIGVASFQHIPTNRERFFVIKNAYRILKYEGKLIMTNRSFSFWFLKKYQKSLLHSFRKYLTSFGKHERNTLMIPRKEWTKVTTRFYHIYTLSELKKLSALSWFVVEQLCYLSKWILSHSWKNSQNSLVIAKKSIFLKNEEY